MYELSYCIVGISVCTNLVMTYELSYCIVGISVCTNLEMTYMN